MKLIIAIILLFPAISLAKSVSVKGYYKKNGKYVHAHHRSSKNKTKADNWSTKGNVNPYTGKPGDKPE